MRLDDGARLYIKLYGHLEMLAVYLRTIEILRAELGLPGRQDRIGRLRHGFDLMDRSVGRARKVLDQVSDMEGTRE